MDYATGYRDGFAAGIAQGMSMGVPAALPTVAGDEPVARSPRKKVSAYNRRYKAAFKKVAPRYKLKSGKWKAGGFKRAVKEAHRIAGGKKR
jgi:hypothetical protein